MDATRCDVLLAPRRQVSQESAIGERMLVAYSLRELYCLSNTCKHAHVLTAALLQMGFVTFTTLGALSRDPMLCIYNEHAQ